MPVRNGPCSRQSAAERVPAPPTALLSPTRLGGGLEREGVRRQLDANLDALHLEDRAADHLGGLHVSVGHAHPADLAIVRVGRRHRHRTGLGNRHRPPILKHVAGLRVHGHQHGRQTGRLELDAIDLSPVELTGAHHADGVVVLAPVAEEHRRVPESRLRELLSCQVHGRRAAHSRRRPAFVQHSPNLHRPVEIDVHSQAVVSGCGR